MIDSTNPRIMATNIRDLASRDVGSNVEANPTGAATADLEKLGVDGTVYGIPVGTTVVANPEGAATDELNKLTVGNGIYSIPGISLSTTPTKIGKYMNENLYAVIIDCGDIAAGTDGKIINHGISNISGIVFYYGIGYNSSDSAYNLLPRTDNDATYQRAMRVSTTTIYIGGASNAQPLTNVKAVVLYTIVNNRRKQK